MDDDIEPGVVLGHQTIEALKRLAAMAEAAKQSAPDPSPLRPNN